MKNKTTNKLFDDKETSSNNKTLNQNNKINFVRVWYLKCGYLIRATNFRDLFFLFGCSTVQDWYFRGKVCWKNMRARPLRIIYTFYRSLKFSWSDFFIKYVISKMFLTSPIIWYKCHCFWIRNQTVTHLYKCEVRHLH